MKKLLAVLCFVPVGLVVLAAIGALLAIVVKGIPLLLTNPLSFLIAMGLVAGLMLAYAAFVYSLPKLIALGAKLWRGDKPKNDYVLIDGEWCPASDAFQLASRWSSNELYYRTKSNDTWEPWVEFGETMKSINSHLHDNKEDSCSTKS